MWAHIGTPPYTTAGRCFYISIITARRAIVQTLLAGLDPMGDQRSLGEHVDLLRRTTAGRGNRRCRSGIFG